MAISEPTVKRVILRFEVQAQKAGDELDNLKKKGGDTASGLLASLKSVNEGINHGIEKLGSLGLAFSGLREILNFSREALKEWGQDLRLEATTAGVSIEALSDALHGMVEEDTLREFAAKTMSGALKLTQQQMETVSKAALALTARGYDLTASLHAMEDAAVTGRMRGLHELGIEVEEGASKFETLKNMMGALDKVIVDTGPHIDTAADKVDRLAAKWADAYKNAKNYTAAALGALVEDPLGIAAEFFGGGSGIETARKNLAPTANENAMKAYQDYLAHQRALNFNKTVAAAIAKGSKAINDQKLIEMPELDVGRTDSEKAKLAKAAEDAAAKAILRGAIMDVARNLPNAGAGFDVQRVLSLQGGITATSGLGQAADTGMYNEYGALQGEQSILDRFNQSQGLRGIGRSLKEGARKNALLKGLGIDDVESFGKDLDIAKAAIEGFSSAYRDALEGIATGNLSLGDGLKKILAGTIHALGDQLAAMSAVEFVKGAALAITLSPEAPLHFAAAGVYGAGAIAAYAAANKMGGSGAGASVSQPGGGASAAAGPVHDQRSGQIGGAPSGGSNVVYIAYGDPYAEDSPRNRRLKAQETMRRAGIRAGAEDS